VEDHDVGQASRLAAATGAYVCFEDEAGQNLRPPKARTWAPRGHPPVIRVSGKGTGRVSVAGLACYKPGARSRLFYRTRTHRGRKGERRSMSEADYAVLVTAAHQHLSAPLILIWDNLNTHISAAMRASIEAHPDWLPAYAPDLNAVGGNLSAADVDQLTAIIKNRLKASGTGPPSSTGSSPRPGSPSNPNPRRPQPFNLCKRAESPLLGSGSGALATAPSAGDRCVSACREPGGAELGQAGVDAGHSQAAGRVPCCPACGLTQIGGLSWAGCGLVPPGCPGPVEDDCPGGGEDGGGSREEGDLPAGHATGDDGVCRGWRRGPARAGAGEACRARAGPGVLGLL
jgi:hypothetical protein